MHRISESMHTGCGDTASSQICSSRADFAAKVQKNLVAAKALVRAAGDSTLIENDLRDAEKRWRPNYASQSTGIYSFYGTGWVVSSTFDRCC